MNMNHQFLSEKDAEFVHEQSLILLEKKGIHFGHKDAIEVFKKHGLKVEGNIVFFERDDVEKAIKLSPRSFQWETRDGSVTVDGREKSLCGSAAGPAFMMDADGTVRRGLLEDYVKICKIVDSSDQLQFVHSLLVDFNDVDTERLPYVQVANLLKYVDKPINLTALQTSSESVGEVAKKQIQMIKKFYGKDGNVVLGGACATSPMHYGTNDVDAIMGFISEKQPISLIACSLPVITSHASIITTIIQNNAEILAGLVLVQLVQPETPFVYATISSSVNLRTVSPLFGSAEVALMSAATASLANYYDVPYRSGGSINDAADIDYQAGAESVFNLAPIIMSDVDVMQFACGSVGSLNITSLEKYLLDEQILRMSFRMKEGIAVDSEKSYVEDIMKVKHKTHFMNGPTPKAFFDEHLIPDIFTKVDYGIWKEKDGKGVVEKATEAVVARLEKYEEKEISAEQTAIIEPFLK